MASGINNNCLYLFIFIYIVTLQVAVASEGKVQKRKRPRISKQKVFKKKRCRKKKKSKNSRNITTISRCVPGCLFKLSCFMGLSKISEKLQKVLNRNFDFEKVIFSFTKDSDFKSEHIPCENFNPLLVDSGHIFVLQICSVYVPNKKIVDNSHSVCLFDKKIFDWNFEKPLSLTKDNLDRCCLGGEDWVYEHCSRVRKISTKVIEDNKKH